MKKQLTSLALLLLAVPFAFWEMKGPFRLIKDKDNVLIYTPPQKEFYESIGGVFFFYDLITRCTLLVDQNNLNNFSEANEINKISFFRSDRPLVSLSEGRYTGYSTFLMEYEYMFILNDTDWAKVNPKATESKINEENFTTESRSLLRDRSDKSYFIKEEKRMTSKVTIEKKGDRFNLIQGDKKKDLQDGLTEYFSNILNNNAIVEAIKYPRYNNHTKTEAQLNVINNLMKATDMIEKYPLILETLRNSKILRVYEVLNRNNYKDSTKGSILFGLAENLKTHRKFYWITVVEKGLFEVFFKPEKKPAADNSDESLKGLSLSQED